MLKPSSHSFSDLSSLYWAGKGGGWTIFQRTALLFRTSHSLVVHIELLLCLYCLKDFCPGLQNRGNYLRNIRMKAVGLFLEIALYKAQSLARNSRSSLTRRRSLLNLTPFLPSIQTFRAELLHFRPTQKYDLFCKLEAFRHFNYLLNSFHWKKGVRKDVNEHLKAKNSSVLPIATSQSWWSPSDPMRCRYANAIWHKGLSLAAPNNKYFQPCKNITSAPVNNIAKKPRNTIL